jgi:hypothetical protein
MIDVYDYERRLSEEFLFLSVVLVAAMFDGYKTVQYPTCFLLYLFSLASPEEHAIQLVSLSV